MRIWSPERSEATEITETEGTESTGHDQHGGAETRRYSWPGAKPRRDDGTDPMALPQRRPVGRRRAMVRSVDTSHSSFPLRDSYLRVSPSLARAKRGLRERHRVSLSSRENLRVSVPPCLILSRALRHLRSPSPPLSPSHDPRLQFDPA